MGRKNKHFKQPFQKKRNFSHKPAHGYGMFNDDSDDGHFAFKKPLPKEKLSDNCKFEIMGDKVAD